MKPFGDWKIGTYENTAALTEEFTPLVAALLSSRGFDDREKAKEFLRDDLELLADPFLMKDMDKAVTRIKQALQMKEKIAVFGDYDVDGITATCLLTSYLQSKGASCEPYIPERLTEGYGLSDEALRSITMSGTTLVVTVDCGVTGAEQSKLAKSLGLDLVITDHHECPDVLPDAIAVVDPRRKDCPYPFKGLAGVGVAFKLLCALEGEGSSAKMLEEYGDLVAIGTIADIMPVVGENRAIIRHGIRSLRLGRRCGLRKLMEEAGLPFREVSGADLSFMLVPKLNAAGRMGQVHVSYDLIMTESDTEAAELAVKLCKLNGERREIENHIFTEICERLTHGNPERKITDPIVVAAGHWHHGVSGIVASRLAGRFGVPAIVICWENGVGRGSCRSFGNFSIFDALDVLKEDLISYGGHFHAAGLTIKHANLANFIPKLKQYYRESREQIGEPELAVDFAVDDLSLLSLENVESLMDLMPWGTENPPPVLALMSGKLDSVTSIGGDRHLKCKVTKGRETLECIYFGVSTKDFSLKPGSYVDLAFEPIVNEFRGVRSVQLILRDARRQVGYTRASSANTTSRTAPAAAASAQTRDALTLCRRFFSGSELMPTEKFLLRPDRSDFAAVWRLLQTGISDYPPQAASRVERITRASGVGNPGKVYICLKVFEETGLITLDENNGLLEVTPVQRKDKADLNSSEILKRLGD
ncbi:MAG: single-stranded-DNA-specific exonuclease RecJ [Oscillospiraceae bacterium]|jgi:single-stranded-DNA-specific exonuclease|nr:single-stranded-DNA-specific exonuclease RecJ [Oscillospiraceae bacterium]